MAQYYNEESVDGAEKVQYHTGASVDGGEMAQYHMVGSANRADERTGSAWQKGQAGGVWKDGLAIERTDVMTGDRNRHQICKRKCLWPVEYATWYTLKS